VRTVESDLRNMLTPIRYHFTQAFNFPAKETYEWCTDFTPQDHQLLGEENTKREVYRISDSTIILKEIIQTANGVIKKDKLVQLYPNRFSWVSTHLSGPNKYSQFIYEISETSTSTSCLDFTALHLEKFNKELNRKEVEAMAESFCKYDSNVWRLLAKAMVRELRK